MSQAAIYVLLTTGILNLLGIAGLFYRLSIMNYQHKLMWFDYAQRKGIGVTGMRTNGRARESMDISGPTN